MNERVKTLMAAVVAMMLAGGVFAAAGIPKASAKALGVTRGKPFSSGIVFVNGKLVQPPYVVERWGTGIRINSVPVTGQIVNWVDFVKTQENVKTEKKEREVITTKMVAASAETESDESTEEVSEEDELDELFDDDAPSAKPAGKAKKARPAMVRQAVKTTQTVVSYSLDGDFVPNDASNELLKKVNAKRTEIDKTLRAGGFVLVGDGYSPVTGEKRMLKPLIKALPEMMKDSSSAAELHSKARSAGFYYLTERICADLFKNRIEYPKIQKLRSRQFPEVDVESSLKDLTSPVF